ncbi:MAG: phosphodiester glycosidase family protein [Legionellales bacterium]|nr:phosphodiester glycosidase family protein [Legionellales bacterium]
MKYLILLLTCIPLLLPAKSIHWQMLAPQMEYSEMHFPLNQGDTVIHAFRFDLSHYHLQLVFARDQQQMSASVKSLALQTRAWLAINGGFFSPELKPLGLRVTQGKLLNSLKDTSWWGIFAITRHHRAMIVAKKDFRLSPDIQFALQAGPRLLINGAIPSLKDGYKERSAIGITGDNRIIILVSDGTPLSTTQLAEIMQDKTGLNCRDALNLDGGSSSQLYATIKHFTLDIPSFREVSDAIIVLPN